ncbi:M15 family metallopeptidase [Paenibacillus sp. GCM10027626]|uniref:M15 family metallopeptidase n=1 Tax=Paenibacillus sp. GCM10027626 TaxID=3273411 RepID=UPI00362692DB
MSKYKPRKGRGKNNFFLIAAIIIVLFLIVRELPGSENSHRPVKKQNVVQGLHPLVAEKKDELIDRAAKIGIRLAITDGFRSAADQDKLYNQGRRDGGQIVTNAKGGQSFHNYGLAIDFALKKKDGEIIWDMEYDGNGNGKFDWMEVVEIAKELGFEWGGDWENFRDYPHLQMSFDLTIADLKRGKRPPKQQEQAIVDAVEVK